MGSERVGYAYPDAGTRVLPSWSGVLFGFPLYAETVFDVLWSQLPHCSSFPFSHSYRLTHILSLCSGNSLRCELRNRTESEIGRLTIFQLPQHPLVLGQVRNDRIDLPTNQRLLPPVRPLPPSLPSLTDPIITTPDQPTSPPDSSGEHINPTPSA